MLKIVDLNSEESKSHLAHSLDEIARKGAQMLLAQALDTEVAEYIGKHKEQKDGEGRALVVRNGKARSRKVTVGSGTFNVSAPRVHDRREGEKFTSEILPPYLRRSANVESLLPVLYLRGLSTNDFKPALVELLGDGASGLSSTSIATLKKAWSKEFDDWGKRFITSRYVYMWADGVHAKVRLGDDSRACLLVITGVTEEGKKEVIAVEPGHRESQEAWAIVLRSLKARGVKAPLLAVADGALGFWRALSDVYPETKHQKCWVHKMVNALDRLPKRTQIKAKDLLRQMMNAETEADAGRALGEYKLAFSEKYPKSCDTLEKNWKELTTFFSFPALHWTSIRTTNPIESAFATVKLRTKATKGAGNAKAACSMAFKLLQQCEQKWRRIRGHQEIPKLMSGVAYKDGAMLPSIGQGASGN